VVFPSPLSYLGGLLCLTPLVVCGIIGLGLWTYYPQALDPEHRPRPRRSRALRATPILLAALWVSLLRLAVLAYESVRFAPSEVVAVQIMRRESETSPPFGPAVVLTEAHMLQSGLSQLAGASAHIRSHEGYSDGYQLRLRLQDEPEFGDRTLNVYRRSSRSIEAVSIVIIGTAEYTCPAFHQWIATTIDPLFPRS
jgi:hypothetical protein